MYKNIQGPGKIFTLDSVNLFTYWVYKPKLLTVVIPKLRDDEWFLILTLCFLYFINFLWWMCITLYSNSVGIKNYPRNQEF